MTGTPVIRTAADMRAAGSAPVTAGAVPRFLPTVSSAQYAAQKAAAAAAPRSSASTQTMEPSAAAPTLQFINFEGLGAGSVGAEARDPAAMVREVLIASQSETSEQRLRALRLLDRASSVHRATTVAALGEAMTDEDATVRAFAIRALAVRGDEGLAMLRRAFRDGSRDDRLMCCRP